MITLRTLSPVNPDEINNNGPLTSAQLDQNFIDLNTNKVNKDGTTNFAGLQEFDAGLQINAGDIELANAATLSIGTAGNTVNIPGTVNATASRALALGVSGSPPTINIHGDGSVVGGAVAFDGTQDISLELNVDAISGNSGTATALETPRTLDITGLVTATGVSFDGTADATLNVTDVTANRLQTLRTFEISGDIVATDTFDGTDNVDLVATLGADTVDGTNIVDDAIDSEHIAVDAVIGDNILDGEITPAKIAGTGQFDFESLSVGNGSPVSSIAVVVAQVTIPSGIVQNTSVQEAITVSGVAIGDFVIANPSVALTDDIGISATCTATDQVTLTITNTQVAATTGQTLDFNFLLIIA